MAVFNSILFRRLRKSAGNVTMYPLGDQNVVRAKASYRRDRKSLAQLKQRARMKAVRELSYMFYSVLQTGFCSRSLREGILCFFRENIGKMEVDDDLNVTFDVLSLSLSGGVVLLPRLSATIDPAGNQVLFRWERQPLRPHGFDDDCLYGVVAECGHSVSAVVPLGTRSSNGELAWTLPSGWNPRQIVVYGFALNANKTRASGTLGLASGLDT